MAGELTAFPPGDSALAGLIRDFDWARTSVGPLQGWPQSLKSITAFLLMSAVPIVLLWGEDGVMIYNDAYSVFAGRRHPDLLGSKVREGWPEVADFNDNVMRVGLAGGTLAYRNQELTLERHGAPEPAWMNLDYSPVVDETGKPAGVVAIVVETTDQVQAERRLRESEGKFRALANATSDILYQMTPDWQVMQPIDGRGLVPDSDTANPNWMQENLYEEDHAAVRAAIDQAVTERGIFQMEHRVRRPDASTGWTFSRAIPILDEAGAITEWFGAASDVTDRHEANAHLRLVINELNHRVKNNLAMMQAIAMQVLRSADSTEQAREKIESRIIALARANDLLTGERSAGVGLRDVIDQAMEGACDRPGACDVAGPDVALTPKTALALTLALHELTTNALKYGAWSAGAGCVSLTWQLREEDGTTRLSMEWRESGGPPVTPPQRRGFGSRLIERGLAAEMTGAATLHFEPEGLRCVIDAPVAE